MSIRSIRNRLYVFSSQELPQKLLDCILKNISDYDLRYQDCYGRLGVAGITENVARRYGFKRDDMINHKKGLEVATYYFRDTVKKIRTTYPELSLQEWYLFSLACYYICSLEKVLEALKSLPEKSWHSYSNRYRYGVDFAERTWEEFRKNKGAIK